MKILKIVVPILFVFFLTNCNNNKDKIDIQDLDLTGSCWGYPIYEDSCWIYKRTKYLPDSDHGFSFHPGKVFIENKNAVWCKNPLIVYNEFEGIWHRKDSIIHIQVGYQGEKMNYQWKIISVSTKHLVIYKIKEEDPQFK